MADPIVLNKRAPFDVAVGDYVFASRWGDCDPGDPWHVGHVAEVSAFAVRLHESPRWWPCAMKITPEQGRRVCEQYPAMEHLPQDYEAIARVFGVKPPGELEYESWRPCGVPAHSKSEYKRRVAQGDSSVQPPPNATVEAVAQFDRDGRPLNEAAREMSTRWGIGGVAPTAPDWQNKVMERMAFGRGVSAMRDRAILVIEARHESGWACTPTELVKAIREVTDPTDPCGVDVPQPEEKTR